MAVRAGTILLALAAAVLLFAPRAAMAKPWRHGIVAPAADAGFSAMVLHGGFADKQGLELETVLFPNDAGALHALLAGDVDSYEGEAAAAIIAAGKHVDVKIIGCPWQSVVHSIFARRVIEGAADLKGQFIAVSAPHAMPELVARAWLAAHGVSPAEVQFASLGNDEQSYKALAGGLVAAAVVSIDFLPLAETAGLKLMGRGGDVAPKFLRRCVIATGAGLAARREDAIRFLAAEVIALRYALAHREEEIALARSVTGAKPDDPRPGHIFAEAARQNGIDPTMPVPLDKLAWMEELLIETGNLGLAFDPQLMVDHEIRDEALARIAKK